MISNESVQRLIACDREALIALMSLSMACGAGSDGRDFNAQLDPDIQMLLYAAWDKNSSPNPWQLIDGTWTRRVVGEVRP